MDAQWELRVLDQLYRTCYFTGTGGDRETPYDSDGLESLYKTYIDLQTAHLDRSLVTYNLHSRSHELSKTLQDNDRIA